MHSLKLSPTLTFSLTLDTSDHSLNISAVDKSKNICLHFKTYDSLSYHLKHHPSHNLFFANCEECLVPRVFWHKDAKIVADENFIEIVSSPLDPRANKPLTNITAHYRFEKLEDVGGVRASTYYTCNEPVTLHQMNWLKLLPTNNTTFNSFHSYEPVYTQKISKMNHALKSKAISVNGEQGNIFLLNCGEGTVVPPLGENALTIIPQGNLDTGVSLDCFKKSTRLTADLVFTPKSGSLPKVSLPKLETVELTGEVYELASGLLTARLFKRNDGVSLSSINLDGFSPTNAEGLLPLTKLKLLDLTTNKYIAATSEKGWGKVQVKTFPSFLEIVLSNPHNIDNLSVKITARSKPKSRIEWTVSVINTNENLSVLSCSYPGTSFHGGKCVKAVTSKFSGQVISGPYSRGLGYYAPYPHGDLAPLPVFGVYDASKDEQNGFYASVHDPSGSVKDFCTQFTVNQHGSVSYDYPAEFSHNTANSFELSGKLIWQIFSRDWYDLAQIYRDFVIKNAVWLPEYGRPDVPNWVKDIPVYIMDWLPTEPDGEPMPSTLRKSIEPKPDDWYEIPIKLANELDLPVCYHIYNWHKIAFDNGYPNYFPTKDCFVKGIDELKKHNIKLMPYINGRLWDSKDKGEKFYKFKDALAHTSKEYDNKPDLESYESLEDDGTPVKMSIMCPSSPLWQKTLLNISQKLFNEFDMDAIYIDQIAAARPNLCLDKTHNHPPGGGDWWRKSYGALLDLLRINKTEEQAFTTECVAEVYMDKFDGYLTWSWISSNIVPLFPAIYSGYITTFGRNTNDYKVNDLPYYRYQIAQSLMFGQQLGWLNADLVNHPQKLSFLKSFAKLRYKHRDYFTYGKMNRPPKLVGKNPKIVTNNGMWMPDIFEGESVLTSLWLKDGKALVQLANLTEEEIFCKLTVDTPLKALTQTSGNGKFVSLEKNVLTCKISALSALCLEFDL